MKKSFICAKCMVDTAYDTFVGIINQRASSPDGDDRYDDEMIRIATLDEFQYLICSNCAYFLDKLVFGFVVSDIVDEEHISETATVGRFIRGGEVLVECDLSKHNLQFNCNNAVLNSMALNLKQHGIIVYSFDMLYNFYTSRLFIVSNMQLTYFITAIHDTVYLHQNIKVNGSWSNVCLRSVSFNNDEAFKEMMAHIIAIA